MPIEIPTANALRLTTGGTPADQATFRHCVAGSLLTNPGPVSISATSPSGSGNAVVVPAVAAAGRTKYFGYNILGNVPAGQSPAVIRRGTGANVEGFSGMTPGTEVYISDSAVPEPVGVFSGLTHTAPAGATNADVIGVAISATKLAFH